MQPNQTCLGKFTMFYLLKSIKQIFEQAFAFQSIKIDWWTVINVCTYWHPKNNYDLYLWRYLYLHVLLKRNSPGQLHHWILVRILPVICISSLSDFTRPLFIWEKWWSSLCWWNYIPLVIIFDAGSVDMPVQIIITENQLTRAMILEFCN